MSLSDSLLENAVRKVADDSIRENASNADRAGLEVRVTRTYDGIGLSSGRECQWCLERECDNVTLQEAYSIGAFQRHPGCGCEISYTNVKGETRIQSWAGGRESWIKEENLERRKQYGIEPTGGPARHELVKRMMEGRDNPDNRGIIAEKILKKEYPLQQRHQKYLQHVKGTPQYNSATAGRGKPQSYLTISEKEAQNIIYNCAGKGILPDFCDNREYISLDRVVGKYYEGEEWHDTRRIMILYKKSGAHIVPVKEL